MAEEQAKQSIKRERETKKLLKVNRQELTKVKRVCDNLRGYRSLAPLQYKFPKMQKERDNALQQVSSLSHPLTHITTLFILTQTHTHHNTIPQVENLRQRAEEAENQAKQSIKRENQVIKREREVRKQLNANRQVLTNTTKECLNLRPLRYKFSKVQKQYNIALQQVSSLLHPLTSPHFFILTQTHTTPPTPHYRLKIYINKLRR